MGGLEIKDPKLMNLTLGAKLVWRPLLASNKWWKKAFITKYFHKNHLTKPEGELWEGKG